jgi:hypothetical protein
MEEGISGLSREERRVLEERTERLRHWLDKGQKILPWLVRFMRL